MRFGQSFLGMCVVTISLAFGASLGEAALIVIDDDRRIHTAEFGTQAPAPGASLFQVTAPTATGSVEHESLLSQTVFWGDLYVYADGTGGVGQSVFDVSFTVDVAMPYTMTGSVSYPPIGQAFLSDSVGNIQTFPNSFQATGVLLPGVEYRLFLSVSEATTNSDGAANFYFAVPEPHGVALGSLLLVSVLLARRQLARREVS